MSVSVTMPVVCRRLLLCGAGETLSTWHVTSLGSYWDALTRSAHSLACFTGPNDSTVSLDILSEMLTLGICTVVVAGGGGAAG